MTATTPTLQSIFNQVAEHLLTQNARSLDPDNARSLDPDNDLDDGCAYRGEGGLKCAVGCLIADEHYHRKLEGKPVIAPKVETALWKSIDPQALITRQEQAPFMALLGKLQRIHDIYPPREWPERLNALAAVFTLTPFTKEKQYDPFI